LACALSALLEYIHDHKNDPAWHGQLSNVLVLSRRCILSHPGAVQDAFRTVEKPLKRRGDKHLVLEFAELAVEDARRSGRTDTDVRAEAHALICGRSWVYQRIDRLDEARVHARKSLDLGEQIRWDRNTAYCKKCIGRLLRMEAERLDKGAERDGLLTESMA